VEGPAELFVEAVARVLAWVDEHKAHLFLMAAVAAGVVALSAALNLWGLVELGRLAYAAVGAPFVAAGVKADERRAGEVVRLVEVVLGGALVPGGGASAEVERWVAGLRSGEVKTAVARAAEMLKGWLKAVKGGRYAYHSSGRAARICAGDACAVKTREWALYFKPVKIEAQGGGAKERWIAAKSPEELEAWLSRAGSAYVAPALFFEGGGVELRVVAVSEAVVDEVRRRLAAVRGASGVQYDSLTASARRGVLAAAKVGDVARMWKAYIDGVESYLTDPAKREELTREAERWVKALRLNTTAEEAVAKGLEMLRRLRESGLFDALRKMAEELQKTIAKSVDELYSAMGADRFWLEPTSSKSIRVCADIWCVRAKVSARVIYQAEFNSISTTLEIPGQSIPPHLLHAASLGWRASDENVNTKGKVRMDTPQAWQIIAWSLSRGGGKLSLRSYYGVFTGNGVSIYIEAETRPGEALIVRDKELAIREVLRRLDEGDPLPLVFYYLGDGVVRRERPDFLLAVGRQMLPLFAGRRDVVIHRGGDYVKLVLRPSRYAEMMGEMYLSGLGTVLDALHSHKWLNLKRLAAYAFSTVEVAGRQMTTALRHGSLVYMAYFNERAKAEDFARRIKREFAAYGIDPEPHIWKARNGFFVQVEEKDALGYAVRNPAAREAVKWMLLLKAQERPDEVHRFLARHPEFAAEEVKQMINDIPAEKPRPRTERRPKERARATANVLLVKAVDGVVPMNLRIVEVHKASWRLAAVRRVKTAEEAEELRRRLRLSGLNVSVVSRGKMGFEVVVPQKELEKLAPEDKEAIRRYLEQKMRESDEEERGRAEEVMRSFDFGVKAVEIGGVRLPLTFAANKGLMVEKYGDPDTIAQIKAAVEEWFRKTVGDSEGVRTEDGGQVLVVPERLLIQAARKDERIRDALVQLLEEKLKTAEGKRRERIVRALKQLKT
jgi:hypothetical protein